jgi:uncharacterized membrane protein
MRIIITATLIYLIIQLIRFLSRIKINRSNENARENLQNSYRNMDIQDAEYEDINRDNN